MNIATGWLKWVQLLTSFYGSLNTATNYQQNHVNNVLATVSNISLPILNYIGHWLSDGECASRVDLGRLDDGEPEFAEA